MSNFQELLSERNSWTLKSDTEIFEKIKNLEFNIFQSAETIHSSVDELTSLCKNADTALNNSINSFNYMRYTKFVENVIDKGDREHLKKTTDGSDSEEEDTIMTEEQEEAHYDKCITEALKIGFDAIGISAKAITDDLISLAENEDADADDVGNATHRRKGLKLPAIYSSQQYEEHPYMGMVEINQLEDDDTPPDLIGDEFNQEPEGFGDPFAEDAVPFAPDEFNPPGDPMFPENAANQNGGPPPPPPPPAHGISNILDRTSSLPAPPPAPPIQPTQPRANSDAHLAGFLQDINRLKAERDAEANIAGDPSEAGSILYNNPPATGPLQPAGAPGGMAPPPPPGFPGAPPPPGGVPPPPGAPGLPQMGQPEPHDPMNDESLFMSGNNIRQNYAQNKKGSVFDNSMIGGGGNMFDDSMNNMSMSMDQDISKHNISNIFGGRQSMADNKPVKATKDNLVRNTQNMFGEIKEDEEEDKYDNVGNNTPPPNAPPPPPQNQILKPGFLDDTVNDDSMDESIMLSRPTANKPLNEKKGLFMDTFEDDESNASMISPPKRTTEAPAGSQKVMEDITATQKTTKAAFDYGGGQQQKKNAFFDDYEEEESVMFPEKKPSAPAMFDDKQDLDNSYISNTSRETHFIAKQRNTNSKNHMMAMIMKGMNSGKIKAERMSSEISIGDDDDPEPEPRKQEEPSPPLKKGPSDYQPAPPKKKPFNFLDETQDNAEDLELETTSKPAPPAPPVPQKDEAKRMFLDDTIVESELSDNLDFSKQSNSSPAPQASQTTMKKNTFLDDEDSDEDDFMFSKSKQPIPPPAPPVTQTSKPKPKPKPFAFDDDDSDGSEKKSTPVPPEETKIQPPPGPPAPPQPPKQEEKKEESKDSPKEEEKTDLPASKDDQKKAAEQAMKLGFLAMMNPNATGKPPPAFIRRAMDPSFEAKEAKESKMELTENAQLEKPILKSRRGRRKKKTAFGTDEKKEETKASAPPPAPAKAPTPPPAKTPTPPPATNPSPPQVKTPAPPPVATPPPSTPTPPPPAQASPPAPKPSPPKEEVKAPPAPAAKKNNWLDDSDGSDEDDDMFAKKTPAAPTTPTPPPVAPQAAAKKMAFLDSDSDNDDDSDGSFD
ncbi:unnamed protein product [Moneuplotes crassus]|uniref:Uncharacterized protein n=1 Tax=Euplotes crassus TaxID=5936 RepID=A0AAD1XN24_EUPCR|nr:unnamed protein product [Moneuplotes crassus]